MTILSLFTSSSSNKNQLRIAIQVDAIYISFSGSDEAPLVVPIETSWDAALEKGLSSLVVNKYAATVVFCSNYYQSYQIDKPELPKDEWSVALPFLLKDLISERVTDVVADASLLPDGKHAQAYVISKSLLTPLVNILTKANVALARVIPEDEIWGYASSEKENFMLLYRAQNDNYKVGAFVNGTNRFQRVIRGVVPPLTGGISSELQLDSVALELQRSTDYLSSQLRDISINDLFVHCDEDDIDELVSELSDRLNIKVSPLTSSQSLQCGQILCNTISHAVASDINLYPSHLKPKREWFTLTTVAASWVFLLFVMFGYYSYVLYDTAEIENVLKLKARQAQQQSSEIKSLSRQAADQKPNPSKLKAIERIDADIQAKKTTLEEISHFDDSLQEGYSGVMTSLAELGRNDISISHIELNEKILNLKGLARTPSSVPKWVKQFSTELNLVGRTFETMNIDRNEDDIVTFELTTKVDLSTSSSTGEK